MRADIFLRRFQPRFLEGLLQDRVQNLGILEWPMRRNVRDKQGTRVSCPPVSDVVDNGFTNIGCKWHTIMQLALAPDQDFARSPVDIVNLNRNDFWRAQSEAGK